MSKNQWVIQEQRAEVNDVDWDMWIIGVIEEGMFVERFRTYDRTMAFWAVEVFKWFELFEEGIVSPTAKVIEKVKASIPKKKINKANS